MKTLRILTAGVLMVGLWACEREGPAERFGEEVDEAVENVRESGETVGNRLDDAADDLRDSVEDARDELEK